MHPPLLLTRPRGALRALALLLALSPAAAWSASPASGAGRGSWAEVAATAVASTVAISGDRGPPRAPGLDELDAMLARPPSTSEERVARSVGSGVILDAQGLVLTNHHVVAGTGALTVTLSDQRRVPARRLASDPRTDIALLQLEGPGPFSAAPLGDSDRVRVGDAVLTVGHPFDFTFSVTSGILSGRGRRGLDPDEIQDFLQVDAAVNPGVSGGPLFDSQGRLIGLVTAVYTGAVGEGPAPTGLSFAIPVDQALRVADDLKRLGYARRSWAGLTLSEDEGGGALLSAVMAGGPAERAGLRAGDRVRSVDGAPVADRADLTGAIQAAAPGATLKLQVERDGQVRPVPLTLAERGQALPSSGPSLSWRGASLTLGEASMGAAAPSPGLRVLAVAPGSPAELAGLSPGDLIRKIGTTDVQDTTVLSDSNKWPSALVLRVWREGGEVVLVLCDN